MKSYFKRNRNVGRNPEDRDISKGMAVIIAREILGPGARVWAEPEGPCNDGEYMYHVELTPSWNADIQLNRRHHAYGYDKRNDYIEVVFHAGEMFQETHELVAVGNSWREALTAAREWAEARDNPTPVNSNQKGELKDDQVIR